MSHSSDSTFATELHRVSKLGYGADVVGSLGGLGTHFYTEVLPKTSGTRVVEVGNLMNNAAPISTPGVGALERRLVFISKYPNRGLGEPDPTWDTEILQYIGEVSFTAATYHAVEGVVARLCAEFAISRGLSFVVLGKRPAWQLGERNFFAKHLEGYEWRYLPSRTQASSYESVSNDDVIVNIDSTLGYEFFSRGLRVASVTARMSHCGHPEIVEQNFGFPFISDSCGPYWTNMADKSEVFRVLNYVTNVDRETWLATTQAVRDSLLVYDEGNARFCSLLDELQIKNSGPGYWSRELVPNN